MRTRVKICGITRPEHGREAARLGADAIGLVFHPDSPRALALDRARAVMAALPPFVTTVGLFVDPPAERVRAVLEALSLDLLQFHGAEPADFCGAFGRPYIKALAVRPGVDIAGAAAAYADARGLLLDAWHPAMAGGTGAVFDWDLIPPELAAGVILAGGLDPDNVAEAITRVRPYGVDVSSGVESSPGVKDPARIAAFMRGVESVVTSG